ncbi:methylated-DNA--[protein]-cysteine S-methyltransferase [Psychrobacter sanguinis]|uniref:methylated-DNA--[protein]-cysteine S-methyltransferase n=1 Tax=Psychrobacter sanguinis TaxID=861445 RepID=UPI000E8C5009|nr:methylated-DNA--[protein]-cysteine S-methyltransferase [Psychrobacter sanguinis]HBH33643.1 cysteine methyltransferase [Psychrobacter sp.]
MIVTITQFTQYRLLLIASAVASETPKLVSLDWLADGQEWSESKSIHPLKKHYKLNDEGFQFIDKNSLSKENPIEALLLTALSQLEHYHTGKLQQFDIPLDLSLGTPFQQSVWRALQQIPYGETISYAQLAQNIDKPTAYRAVANANGKNPFSIIIPCHRVVASDGGLGGYTGGLDKKRLLLEIEKPA